MKQYIDEENRYAESEMAHTKELQRTIYNELVYHMKEDNVTPMEQIDGTVCFMIYLPYDADVSDVEYLSLIHI